jgi:hypothetical protein
MMLKNAGEKEPKEERPMRRWVETTGTIIWKIDAIGDMG